MKQVKFDNNLEHLVDGTNAKYEGKRFRTVYVQSSAGGFPSFKMAEDDALLKLQERAREERAEAYEVAHASQRDPHQEYDSTPCHVSVIALLYKSQ